MTSPEEREPLVDRKAPRRFPQHDEEAPAAGVDAPPDQAVSPDKGRSSSAPPRQAPATSGTVPARRPGRRQPHELQDPYTADVAAVLQDAGVRREVGAMILARRLRQDIARLIARQRRS